MYEILAAVNRVRKLKKVVCNGGWQNLCVLIECYFVDPFQVSLFFMMLGFVKSCLN